jgi:hypothetical protein
VGQVEQTAGGAEQWQRVHKAHSSVGLARFVVHRMANERAGGAGYKQMVGMPRQQWHMHEAHRDVHSVGLARFVVRMTVIERAGGASQTDGVHDTSESIRDKPKHSVFGLIAISVRVETEERL